jgi:transglutaminase-like putative cysteine protease
MKATVKKEKQSLDKMPLPDKGLSVSRWGNLSTCLSLSSLFLTLGIAIFSIEQAQWISPQPYFTLVLFFSVVLVWLLTATRLPGWALHLVMVAAGILVTLWQGTIILPSGSGSGSLFAVFSSWLRGGTALQESDGKVIFGVFLVLLTWITGYLSTWFMLRRHNAWVAVLLGLVIIIVNLSNLPGNNLVFFTFFLLAGVLLIIQTNITRQQYLPGQKTKYSRKSLLYLGISLFCIVIMAVSLAWQFPQPRLPALQNDIAASMPRKNGVLDSVINVFNAVPSKQVVNTASQLQDLNFGTSWNAGDDIRYAVISPQPAYWQVNVYDIYTSQNWISTDSEETLRKKKANWNDNTDIPGRVRVEYEVIPYIDTDVVLITGNIISADMPLLVRKGEQGEITGARAPRVLNPGEKYTVRTYVADSSAAVLSAAGDNYTDAIKAIGLQLPDSFPEKIKALSENLTRDALTPYAKIMAINAYLANIPYSKEVKPLPPGVDAVSDFLFTQKKGFCLHFASAMTVMLRSIGVPARLIVGYLPGDPGTERGTYILRDRQYHAWTQVYFPGYGWINFEPTPSGNSEDQLPANTALVSTSNLRQLPEWDYWDLPYDTRINNPVNIPVIPRTSWKMPFADALGLAAIIILSALAVFGLFYVLVRIIRPFYSRQIWNIDRQNPASSAYTNLCRLAAMNGIIQNSLLTPLEVSYQIAKIIPEQTQNLEFLVWAYLGKRFGPDKGKPELYEEAEILKARILVYNAILEKQGRIQKYLWKS